MATQRPASSTANISSPASGTASLSPPTPPSPPAPPAQTASSTAATPSATQTAAGRWRQLHDMKNKTDKDILDEQ